MNDDSAIKRIATEKPMTVDKDGVIHFSVKTWIMLGIAIVSAIGANYHALHGLQVSIEQRMAIVETRAGDTERRIERLTQRMDSMQRSMDTQLSGIRREIQRNYAPAPWTIDRDTNRETSR